MYNDGLQRFGIQSLFAWILLMEEIFDIKIEIQSLFAWILLYQDNLNVGLWNSILVRVDITLLFSSFLGTSSKKYLLSIENVPTIKIL